MADQLPSSAAMTVAELIGSWQCYKGDGIHGWEDQVLFFRTDAHEIILEIWVRRNTNEGAAALRLFGPYFVQCSTAPDKLILTLDDEFKTEWNIWRREGDTFMLTHPYSTAGTTFFRKTPKPKRRKP